MSRADDQRRWRKRHPEQHKALQAKWRKLVHYQRELRRDRKRKLIELKGGRCIDCGFSGHPAALQFDHLDPTTKVAEVTTLIRVSWERALAESQKCDLVCANCHAIRTFVRRPQ